MRVLSFGRHVPGVAGRLTMLFGAALALAGCQAADTVINHGQLDVQTHMSETIFLDPVPDSLKTVYVSARNTSDHPELDVRTGLIQAIAARGYQIETDPTRAHYMLRVNVLQAGKIKQDDTSRLLASGYGEPLLNGAIAGGIAAGLSGGNAGAAYGTGLGIAAGTFLANELVQDVTYAVTVDIQLSERPLSGKKVHQHTSTYAGGENHTSHRQVTSASQYEASEAGGSTSNSHSKQQDIDEDADFKQYQVRSVAYADKVNLKFEEAAPVLTARMTSSLSNLFE